MNRVASEIQKRIDSTKATIESARRQYDESVVPHYLADLDVGSLEQRLRDLEREYEQITNTEDREQVTIVLHPPGMEPGHIPIRSLSQILGGLQLLSDSVANTLFNQPSERGNIPQEILDYNTLIWREARAGSFEVVLDMPHSPQEEFHDPVQVQTLQELFRLFNSADKTDLLMESISALGPRTLKHYREWTRVVRDNCTPVEIEWSSSIMGKEKISFTIEKVDRIYSVLSNISDTTEEEVTLSGRLTGANVRTKSFELFLFDGEKITGRIAKDAVAAVARIVLDSTCKANLLKSVTRFQSIQREKVTWTLQGITDEHN